MNLNFSAPINSSGYGQAGLNLLLALRGAGCQPALFPLGGGIEAPPTAHAAIRQALERAETFSKEAPSVRLWHQFDLAQHVGRGLQVGFPIFELDRFTPREQWHLGSQDLLLATSRWAMETLLEHCQRRVRVVPLGVDRSVFHEKVAPAAGPVSTTRFLNVGKWEVRKGHDLLIEAFSKAFSPSDDVQLTLCCHNPFVPGGPEAVASYNRQWQEFALGSRLGQAGKVGVYRNRLDTQAEVAALMASADYGVFPARAEGWNLEALEMLSMGKKVILTDYSAHRDFAAFGSGASLPIETEGLEDAWDGVWFKGQGRWAHLGSKSEEQLVEQLRLLHRERQEQGPKVSAVAIQAAERFTWDKSALALLAALEQT